MAQAQAQAQAPPQLKEEETKSQIEVYHGVDICKAKSLEMLKEINLPNGLLPLKDMEECGMNRETGYVWMKQKKKVTHKFEKIDRLVTYDLEVTAYVEKGRIKKLTGVKTKELLLWVTLCDIYIDDPASKKITFKTPTGLYRTFPTSAFEVEDPVKETVAVEVPVPEDVDAPVAAPEPTVKEV